MGKLKMYSSLKFIILLTFSPPYFHNHLSFFVTREKKFLFKPKNCFFDDYLFEVYTADEAILQH